MCPSCSGQVELDAAFCGVCGGRLRARRDTLVGTVLADQYRIDSKIAEGGFGSIYQATHLASGLDVALKVLHADLAADPSLAARFRREGETLSRLHDPHTVATYDVGESRDGTLYIAMELLRGESLHDRMVAAGPIAWRAALVIIRDLCSSLAEAHDLGIVHRDLKPANVHLAAGDVVKLLDFGIAKLTTGSHDPASELTRLGQTIGTLEYMAPEQIIGGSCETRSDIYQLGVLMFEMITGRRPFAEASEPTALITALLTQTPPVPSTLFGCSCLPPEIDALILRCLEREPEHRFTNVRELDRAIVEALDLRDASGAHFLMSSDDGDEATWVGNEPVLIHAHVPRITSIGHAPRLAPAAMPSFEVPVRGSVSDGLPLDDGGVTAVGDYIVEPLSSPARAVSELPVTLAPARGMSFASRIALWTIGLAATGAAIGGVIAIVAG